MEQFDCLNEFKNKYKEFIDFLIPLLPTDIVNLKKAIELLENKDHITTLTTSYIGRINSKERYKRQLLERNIKLFYKGNHEKSLVVIPNIGMKSVLSKISASDEKEVWGYLQLFYIILEPLTPSSKKYIKILIDSIEKQDRIGEITDGPEQEQINERKEVQEQLESCKSGNELVDNMVHDIANVFQNNFETSNEQTNPMGAIFNTLSVISDKYTDKMKSGQITLSDMLSSLVKLNNTIKDPSDGDEKGADLSPILEKMMKSEKEGKEIDPNELLNDLATGSGIDMGEIMGLLGSGIGSGSGSGSLLSSIFGGDNSNSNVPAVPLTEEQIKEMEQFYASMSLGNDASSSGDKK
jgi:hypothetical protein